jgi:hypothetical protein
MITKAQAVALSNGTLRNDLHYTGKRACTRIVGPRGGVTIHVITYRVNGQCQTWITRPNDFRLPVKYGLREYGYVDQTNAHEWHLANECPLDVEVNRAVVEG